MKPLTLKKEVFENSMNTRFDRNFVLFHHTKGGEKSERPRRSKSRDKSSAEGGEDRPRRHRSKSRDRGENGEEKPRRSKSRDPGEGGEDKPRRSKSKSRDPEKAAPAAGNFVFSLTNRQMGCLIWLSIIKSCGWTNITAFL